MQRRGATSGQRRPQGRRLAAKRFFNGGNGGLLGRGGRFNAGSCGLSGDGGRRALGHGLWPHVLLDRFMFCNCNGTVGFPVSGACSTLQALPDDLRDRFVNGAGVGLLFGNTELGQHVDNRVRRNFELPCQLVDADFNHR